MNESLLIYNMQILEGALIKLLIIIAILFNIFMIYINLKGLISKEDNKKELKVSIRSALVIVALKLINLIF